MENRFGVKDFFLFLLLGGLMVLVVLSIWQYDRQWAWIQTFDRRLAQQADDFRQLQLALEHMPRTAAVIGDAPRDTQVPTPVTAADSSPRAPQQPTSQPVFDRDPFARINTATTRPNYARGDWLIDTTNGRVATLTPLISGDANAAGIHAHVLESLATRDPDTLQWTPLLAKDWTISPDGLRITFRLRDQIYFSDGQPVTADDVVFTYQFSMNKDIAAPRTRAYLDNLADVQMNSPREVTFIFKQPYFLAFSIAGGMEILPRHFYEGIPAEEFNKSTGYLMGSGPYRLEDPKSWKPGSDTPITLVRNEHYWGAQPALERLVYREFSNDIARLASFRNGEIDYFGATPDQYHEMLTDTALLQRTHHLEFQNPVGGYRFIAWNQKHDGKPSRFADKRVRQAMTLLIDRQRIIDQLMLGYAVVATGPFNPLSQQCNPEIKPWPYDPARAQQLLSEAGYTRNGDGSLVGPDGVVFEVKLTYPSGRPDYEKFVLFVKDSLAEAGISVQLDALEWAVFTDRLKKKNFEAISLGWTTTPESDIYQMFHSSQMIDNGDNFCSY